jgi:hypothetical protein
MDFYESNNNDLKPFEIDKNAFCDTVSLFAGKPVVFFYSAGLKPINISFLNRIIGFYRIENELLLERAHVALVADVKDSIEDKTIEYCDDKFKEQSTSNIKLLGFLGSFIAFVSAGVHSLNSELGADNFGRMLKTVVACILSFVVMINFLTLPNDKEINKRFISFIVSLAFAVFLIYVLLCL